MGVMTRVHALSLLLGLGLVLAVTHNLAYQYSWYWHYWWLDLLMHLGGGAFIAGVTLLSGAVQRPLKVVAVVLTVGVAWEVFELVTKITYSRSYALDTSLDLLMDVCGALLLCAIMHWWHKVSQSTLPVAHAE